jgi:hypothetical protein
VREACGAARVGVEPGSQLWDVHVDVFVEFAGGGVSGLRMGRVPCRRVPAGRWEDAERGRSSLLDNLLIPLHRRGAGIPPPARKLQLLR